MHELLCAIAHYILDNMRSKSLFALPLSVSKTLRVLGDDLRIARIRRRMTVKAMAERAFVSQATVARIEKGDTSVSMGIYASVLFVLGLHEGLGKLAAADRDDVGMALLREDLPKRVRAPRKKDTWR